jgi:flagellar motor component MotA
MGRMGYAGGVLTVWFILGVVGIGVAAWLGRRIWRGRKTTPLTVRLVRSMIAAALTLGAVGTLLGLVKAYGAVGGEDVDPSQKARILAEGISEAMNCTALGFAVAVSSIILAVIARRLKRSK